MAIGVDHSCPRFSGADDGCPMPLIGEGRKRRRGRLLWEDGQEGAGG